MIRDPKFFLFAVVVLSTVVLVAMIREDTSGSPTHEEDALSVSAETAPDARLLEEILSSSAPTRFKIAPPTEATRESGAKDSPATGDQTVAALQARIAELEKTAAILTQKLEWCMYPADTAYGAFLHMPESSGFSEEEKLCLRLLVEDFPGVRLFPGEATELLRILREEEGGERPGERRLDGIVRFLGVQRARNALKGRPDLLREHELSLSPALFAQLQKGG